MNDTETTQKPASRRFFHRKNVGRMLFGLACLATILFLFVLEENIRGKRAWNEYKRELENKGIVTEPAALIPKPVPDAENFAMTPWLAPILDFNAGAPGWKDTNAVNRIREWPKHFKAVLGDLPSVNAKAPNSWLKPKADFVLWFAAYTQTNRAAARAAATEAFAERYGLNPAAGSSELVVPTNMSPAAAAAGVLAVLSAETDPVIDELRQAVQRPYSRFNVNYREENPAAILLPHLAEMRRIANVLQMRASAALAAGKTDQAFEESLLAIQLCGKLRGEPILISYLVRISMLTFALQPVYEGLEQHAWTDAQLQALQQELAPMDFLAEAQLTLVAERVFFGAVIDYVRTSPSRYQQFGSISGLDGELAVPEKWQEWMVKLIPEGWFYLEKLNYNRVFIDHVMPILQVEKSRVDVEQAKTAEQEIGRLVHHPGLQLMMKHRLFTSILIPSIPAVARRASQAQTLADTAGLACALERCRLAMGEYPATLEKLAPAFCSRVPHDVITGKPLLYKRAEPGKFLLYSVGWNQTDDGGKIVYEKNGRTPNNKEGDWVW